SGMLLSIHSTVFDGIFSIYIQDFDSVEDDLVTVSFDDHFLGIPFTDGLEMSPLGRGYPVQRTVVLVRLQISIYAGRIVQYLKFHSTIRCITTERCANSEAIIGAWCQLEFKSEIEIIVFLFGVKIARSTTGGRIYQNDTILRLILGLVTRPAIEIKAIEQWHKSFFLFFCGQQILSGRNFLNVQIPESNVGSVCLQFDGTFRENWNRPIPIVFHDNVIHDQVPVQPDRHLFIDHDDLHMIPVSDGHICHLSRVFWMFLVVVQSSGSHLCTDIHPGNIPDLDLWSTPQINTAVSLISDSPVDQHYEIFIIPV